MFDLTTLPFPLDPAAERALRELEKLASDTGSTVAALVESVATGTLRCVCDERLPSGERPPCAHPSFTITRDLAVLSPDAWRELQLVAELVRG